jgi:hypothetical protein
MGVIYSEPAPTVERAYTEDEMRACNEGYEARRQGVDYFESPYLIRGAGRNIYLICAWGAGYAAAETGESKEAA